MTYLTIEYVINDIEKSLEDNNYISALISTLSLPSMGSRLMFTDDYNYRKDNGNWLDRKCYVDFCKKIFFNGNDGYFISLFGESYFDVLYELCCDLLHAGSSSIKTNDGRLILWSFSSMSTEFTKYQLVNVHDFCKHVISCVKAWLNISLNYKHKDYKGAYLFDLSNYNDKLLYDKLCESDRADMLLSEFNSYQESKLS